MCDLCFLTQTPESVSHGCSEYHQCRRDDREGPDAPKVRQTRLHPPERGLREPLLVYLNHAGAHLPTGESVDIEPSSILYLFLEK